MNVLLVQISSLEVLRVLLYSICGLSFLHGGHLENRPTWRVGSKISSVNILILIQGGPMNNVIPLPDDPSGVHGEPFWPTEYLVYNWFTVFS